jgi:hypothetical protein
MTDFLEYVMSFYSEGGIYDMGATREDILMAIGVRIERFPAIPFHGDSLDREQVRDILIERFGYKWPEAA